MEIIKVKENKFDETAFSMLIMSVLLFVNLSYFTKFI